MSTFLILLFRGLARLPLSWLLGAGDLMGRTLYHVAPRYRQTLRENLHQAGVVAAAEFERTALRAAGHAGQSALELPWLWLRPAGQVMTRVSAVDWELVVAAKARGRGIIFLTPHLGSFEVTAQYFAANPDDGAPITVLYRPPRKPALRPLVERFRTRANLHLAAADLGGVRRLVRALRRGEAVGLLPDQVPSRGEGVWAEFFGRPAYTMTLPARLSAMTGATILLAIGEREPRARGYRVRIYPFDEAFESDVEAGARRINAAMEALIRVYPEQYFWAYRRYKVPAGVAPPVALR